MAQRSEYAVADSLYRMGREQEALERFKSLRAKYSDGAIAADVIWWLGIIITVITSRNWQPDIYSRLSRIFLKAIYVTMPIILWPCFFRGIEDAGGAG